MLDILLLSSVIDSRWLGRLLHRIALLFLLHIQFVSILGWLILIGPRVQTDRSLDHSWPIFCVFLGRKGRVGHPIILDFVLNMSLWLLCCLQVDNTFLDSDVPQLLLLIYFVLQVKLQSFDALLNQINPT